MNEKKFLIDDPAVRAEMEKESPGLKTVCSVYTIKRLMDERDQALRERDEAREGMQKLADRFSHQLSDDWFRRRPWLKRRGRVCAEGEGR